MPHSSTEKGVAEYYHIVINIHNVSTSHKDNFTFYYLHYNNKCYSCCHFLVSKLVLESNASWKISKTLEFFKIFLDPWKANGV